MTHRVPKIGSAEQRNAVLLGCFSRYEQSRRADDGVTFGVTSVTQVSTYGRLVTRASHYIYRTTGLR
jgi:hypothetical protein